MTAIRTTLSILLLIFSLAACAGSARASPHVTSGEAHALVEHGATLLDVRTQAEWDGRHLPGARLIPLSELEARMSEIPRDHPVVVYCQSGGRSAQAATMLGAAGYDVHDLGGIDAW